MEEKLNFISYVPIFSDLEQGILEHIASVGVRKNFTKDSVIMFENDPATSLFIIIKGKVKVSRTSEDGKEVIICILGEADFFGEMSIIDGLESSANIIAVDDTELFSIKKQDFEDLLMTHPAVSIALLREMTKRIRAVDMKIKSLSIKDAAGKVATVLIQLADDMGKIKNGNVEIDKLPYQHDLANMAGTSRETISRTLHSFAKKGFVELDGSSLRIINYQKFKETFA